MIYKQTSVKQVIAKVLTDNDMQEETHRIVDMLGWCAEAIEKIGAFTTLQTSVTGKDGEPLLEIQNYQVELPLQLHGIIQVGYSQTGKAPFFPMRQGTGSFDKSKGVTVGFEEIHALEIGEAEVINNTLYGTREEELNEMGSEIDLTYVVTPYYMKFNVPTGFIMMAYTSITVDDEGFPMIPDDISYIEALYWYVSMKLMYPEWKMGRVRDEVYYDARRSWNYYCKQAYGNAMMPDTGSLEAIKNIWNRLIPELGEQNGFFSTIGQQQNIYNANRGGLKRSVGYGKI